MKITVVTGTARIDNISEQVGAYLATTLLAAGGDATHTAVAEHLTQAVTTPPWGVGGADSTPTAWKALVAETDVFVFILPEYNHSYPGEWKILMDSLYPEYKGKTAYVVGVGGGQFAGARVMEHVMPVLVNFQFTIANQRLHIASASRLFAEPGVIADTATKERIDAFVTSIIATAI